MAAVLQGKGKKNAERQLHRRVEEKKIGSPSVSSLSLISRTKDVISSNEQKWLSSGSWLLTACERQSHLIQSLPDLQQAPGGGQGVDGRQID